MEVSPGPRPAIAALMALVGASTFYRLAERASQTQRAYTQMVGTPQATALCNETRSNPNITRLNRHFERLSHLRRHPPSCLVSCDARGHDVQGTVLAMNQRFLSRQAAPVDCGQKSEQASLYTTLRRDERASLSLGEFQLWGDS
jgi:hypothetical protein